MTENQSNAIIKNPNTKKAIAVLQKFAKLEAQYKALEKESKSASKLIQEAMIEQGIEKVNIDMPGLTGFITLASRTTYKTEDLEQVEDDYKKLVLDTDKVKAQATLTGEMPSGVTQATTQYVVKKFKVEK